MSDRQDKDTSARPTESAPKPQRGFLRRVLLRWYSPLLAVLLALCLFILTPLGRWALVSISHVDDLHKADYIVVLGGDYARAAEGARLYREGWAPKVIVTSHDEDARQLAEATNLYGVPKADIIVDDKAARTNDHPRTVAALPGVSKAGRFIIVTSSCHTTRARACFLKGGYSHVLMRCPEWEIGGRYEGDIGPLTRAGALPAFARELAAWCMYKLRGWL